MPRASGKGPNEVRFTSYEGRSKTQKQTQTPHRYAETGCKGRMKPRPDKRPARDESQAGLRKVILCLKVSVYVNYSIFFLCVLNLDYSIDDSSFPE